MLQIIFMALLLGGVIKSLGETASSAENGFRVANIIMMRLITVVMQLAPLGVFALMVKLGATLNSAIFLSVLGYVVLILSLLVLWIFVVYPFAVSAFTPITAAEFRKLVNKFYSRSQRQF